MSNLDDLRKLRKRIEEEADKLNLQVGGLTIVPGKDEQDNDILNVMFLLTPEAVETIEETEQRKIDSAFDALFGAEFGDDATDFVGDDTKKILEAEEAKKQKAKDELQRILDEMD